MPQPWLILDMDEGVIRREPTRRAAVAWIVDCHGGRVVGRHNAVPGSYEYHVGDPADEYDRVCYFVERLDAAARNGWGDWFAVPDLYPFADRAHETGPDAARNLAIRKMRHGA